MNNRKKFKLTLVQKRAITGLLFISPWLVGFLYFYVRSIAKSVSFSLSEINIAETGGYISTFVGLEKYKYIFTVHGTFNQTLVTSIRDTLIDIFLIVFFSLFISILINQKFRGRTLVRAIFFIPVILSSEAIASAIAQASDLVLGGISTASEGISNATSSGVDLTFYTGMLVDFGLPSGLIDYIVDAVSRLSDVISASGVQIVIFLAALQSIPSSLYEVSKIEGATAYETFWKVTFPMVMPHIITCVVYTVVDSFISSPVVEVAYDTAFGATHDFGMSAAMSVSSTLITCAMLFAIVAVIQKRTFYYN